MRFDIREAFVPDAADLGPVDDSGEEGDSADEPDLADGRARDQATTVPRSQSASTTGSTLTTDSALAVHPFLQPPGPPQVEPSAPPPPVSADASVFATTGLALALEEVAAGGGKPDRPDDEEVSLITSTPVMDEASATEGVARSEEARTADDQT